MGIWEGVARRALAFGSRAAASPTEFLLHNSWRRPLPGRAVLAADATAVLSAIAPRALRHGGPIKMRPDSDALAGPALPLAVCLDTPRPKFKSAATRVMSAKKRANAVKVGVNQACGKRLAGRGSRFSDLAMSYSPAVARGVNPDLSGPYALTGGSRRARRRRRRARAPDRVFFGTHTCLARERPEHASRPSHSREPALFFRTHNTHL